MEAPLTQHIRPDREPLDLKAYAQAGGYQAVHKALKSMTPQEVQKAVKDSNLRGRGGAGFSTGLKWSFVPMGPTARRPKYLAVNADEMEPGTFKDRLLLEGAPHQMIEAVIVSAFAIEAEAAFIFLRWAYKRAAAALKKAIAEAYAAGYLGRNILGSGYNIELTLHVSAGRYMCGEEYGLLNGLEGRRPTPRTKPPYPQTSGLWGKPTVVNNVETLCNVPHIVNRGPEWFRGLSRTADGGTKIYGVSGKVRKPGLWELPMGTSGREIIEEYAGGMGDGLGLRGLLPGGASTPFLPAGSLDVPMDFDHVQAAGSRLGTGTMIVLDDRTCPVGMVANLLRFFARESCGWCTPCREGLPWAQKLASAIEAGQGVPEDLDRLDELTVLLGPGRTFCALAPGAMEPLESALKLFREDFERHIRLHRCPWR